MTRRECFIELGKENTLGEVKEPNLTKGWFLGVYQHAHPYTALLKGEQSGQVMDPVAVVEVNGRLLSVKLSRVKFDEGGSV